MNDRTAHIERRSKETEITAELNIDGTGASNIQTPIGLLDHMLELLSFHGLFDLTLKVHKADLKIDIHHTNEDIGIVLGKAFKAALGEKKGLRRFGSAFAPMESTLGHSVIDISGRGHFTLVIKGDAQTKPFEGYTMPHLEHFLESFANALGATICVSIQHPSDDLHTNIETVFKSLGMALDQATQPDPRRGQSVPSTKGIID